jgi:hypothetical protein
MLLGEILAVYSLIEKVLEWRTKIAKNKALPDEFERFRLILESARLLLEQIEGDTQKCDTDDELFPLLNQLETAIKEGAEIVRSGFEENKSKAYLFTEDTAANLKSANERIYEAIHCVTASNAVSTRAECAKMRADFADMKNSFDALVLEKSRKNDDPHDEALQWIRKCDTMDDFLNMYESTFYQKCLLNLKNAVGNIDKKVWAKEWAIRMLNEKPYEQDMALNRDRKVCLQLLYTLCKRWKSQSDLSITESTIADEFEAYRIKKIMLVSLPMDQAQALYKMKYDDCEDVGMHWVARQHVEKSPEWKTILKENDGEPTINECFLWLTESKLDLALMAELLQPQYAQWYKKETMGGVTKKSVSGAPAVTSDPSISSTEEF